MTNQEKHTAQRMISRILSVEVAAKSADKRRVLCDERCAIMSAVQRRDTESVTRLTTEAERTLDMWSAYA